MDVVQLHHVVQLRVTCFFLSFSFSPSLFSLRHTDYWCSVSRSHGVFMVANKKKKKNQANGSEMYHIMISALMTVLALGKRRFVFFGVGWGAVLLLCTSSQLLVPPLQTSEAQRPRATLTEQRRKTSRRPSGCYLTCAHLYGAVQVGESQAPFGTC